MVRTNRHNHRPVAGDSELAEAIKVLARAHQTMIWSRTRQTNFLRSSLREFYPAALVAFDDLTSGDALEVLKLAPRRHSGPVCPGPRSLPPCDSGGRQRRVDQRAGEIQQALRAPQLQGSALVATAMGSSVSATVAVIATMNAQVAELAQELEVHFEQHPDAEVVRSLPGLGTILSARVLGEFGDEPNRYATGKCRKNYAGTSTITRASAPDGSCSPATPATMRLADAIYLWAFASLTASPGARAFYDYRRAAGDTRHAALRHVGNRLVGILHGCLVQHTDYDESTAWGHRTDSNLRGPLDNLHAWDI